MVVVMSRRISVALCQALIALRPGWHSDSNEAGGSQGGDDGIGLRPARMADPHQQHGTPRGPRGVLHIDFCSQRAQINGINASPWRTSRYQRDCAELLALPKIYCSN
jgi:hypothetical protein